MYALPKILYVLKNGEPHSFSELRQKAKVSEPTLSKHLKRLVEKEIVKREIKPSFPPRVYYTLLKDIEIICPLCHQFMDVTLVAALLEETDTEDQETV